jgi:hypothetical protein
VDRNRYKLLVASLLFALAMVALPMALGIVLALVFT